MSETRDFWSRRKVRVAAEAEAEEVALETRAIAAEQAEKSDDEILTDLGLPDPDTMDAGDDFSGFMARAVPDRIRLRALRKLWLTNPVLANVDGLVEYGEDFTDAACVIENMATTYQVGKGMTEHVEEMARQAALEAQEAGEEPAAEEDEAPDAEPMLADAEAESETPEPEVPAETVAPAEPVALAEVAAEDEIQAAPRRRMRFQFEDQAEEVAQA